MSRIFFHDHNSEIGSPFEKLPKDMISEILSYLPVKQLTRMKEVSKNVKACIDQTPKLRAIIDYSKMLFYVNKAAEKVPKLHFSERSHAFYQIVKAEAKYRLAEGKKNALKIQQISFRNDALIEIIKAEAKTQPDEAKKTIQEIQDPSYRNEALMEIIKAEAITHPEEAKKTIQKIQKRFCKAEALIEIIKAEAKTQPEEAKKTVQEIRNPIFRDQALVEIIKAEAITQPEKAKTATQEIEYPSIQREALLEIARAQQALGQLHEAMNTIQEIQDEKFKVKALLVLALRAWEL
ncbi:MAG: hypothetical protein JJU12_08570 [Chlamydiales bacterium]|nr:hypothetical protein [Chlamydiales bacterium]